MLISDEPVAKLAFNYRAELLEEGFVNVTRILSKTYYVYDDAPVLHVCSDRQGVRPRPSHGRTQSV